MTGVQTCALPICQPKVVDVGDDTIDDVPDDAAEFLSQMTDEEKEALKDKTKKKKFRL